MSGREHLFTAGGIENFTMKISVEVPEKTENRSTT